MSVVEQVIRPTGLVDPVIEIVPIRGQVKHLVEQIRERSARDERTLVTTHTKKLAEDLSDYFTEQGLRWRVVALRVGRLRARRGAAQVAGEPVRGGWRRVNLLREGLTCRGVARGHHGRRQGRVPAQRNEF